MTHTRLIIALLGLIALTIFCLKQVAKDDRR